MNTQHIEIIGKNNENNSENKLKDIELQKLKENSKNNYIHF